MRANWLPKDPVALSAILLPCIVGSCWSDDPATTKGEVSSRSYKGHEDGTDANNLVGVYPSLVGTRLDDCQSCHTGRMEAGELRGSSCDYCHDLLLQGNGHQALETLNGFGRDYLEAGRSREALEAIGARDSVGDGHSHAGGRRGIRLHEWRLGFHRRRTTDHLWSWGPVRRPSCLNRCGNERI